MNKNNKFVSSNLVESLLPPILFRFFKSSSLYPKVVRIATGYSGSRTAQIVPIAAGTLTGYKLKLDPTGPWQHEMISGEYDQELFEHIAKLSLTDKVIYDIGAHIGYHSLGFAKMAGPNGHVYAFEPNPANAQRAEEIAALNPELDENITILNLALSNEAGSTNFLSTDDIEGGTSTGGFIDDASTLWERDRYIDKVGFKLSTVTLETIDHLIATKQIQPPDLMKVDVEGAEQLVLGGAQQTLREHKPTIIIEFHSIYSAFACMNILQEYSYQYTLLKQEPDGRVMILAKQS